MAPPRGYQIPPVPAVPKLKNVDELPSPEQAAKETVRARMGVLSH